MRPYQRARGSRGPFGGHNNLPKGQERTRHPPGGLGGIGRSSRWTDRDWETLPQGERLFWRAGRGREVVSV